MIEAQVAQRYADALFGVASQHNIVNEVSGDLNSIQAALESDQSFRNVVMNPDFNREAKLRLLESVLGDRVTALTMQLVRLLLEKRRETLFSNVVSAFDRRRREESNVAYIEVTSAYALGEAERNAIVKKIEASSGKRVEAEFNVDTEIRGGVAVTYGNYVLDGTVQGSLARLRDRLTYDVLKQI